jgi:NAD(P)-dependent dehydrogenase (short-subunit alcohol dehydrogenase family)
MSAFDLSGRRAVVVGGTSGIGRALALGLAEAGADVVATGRRKSLVDEVAAEIEKRGRRTLRIPADVGDAGSLERVRDGMLDTLGGLDILICAAGTTKKVPTLDMEEADWARILDTNLTGTLRSCQVFGRQMVKQRSGRIITIASLTSFLGMFEVAAYAASKSAVAGLTRSLAGGVGARWRGGERDSARRVQDGSEQRAARLAAWAGIPDAHADAAVWEDRRTGRCGGVPGI